MMNSICFTTFRSFTSPINPGMVVGDSNARKVVRVNKELEGHKVSKFRSIEVMATNDNKRTKPNSIVCADCDGKGSKQCGQCQGTGVNSVDHFDGRFKAGGLCWLCRGKKEILCGNCNGAGFLGGYMTAD